MARKHFDEYLSMVTHQYIQLNETLKDMSTEVEDGMIEPERLEQLKSTIAPVKQSFDTLNYIKYLLDKPTRSAKHKRYDGHNKKVIEATKDATMDKVVARNNEVIGNLSNCI